MAKTQGSQWHRAGVSTSGARHMRRPEPGNLGPLAVSVQHLPGV
jgi:hypothetical protein